MKLYYRLQVMLVAFLFDTNTLCAATSGDSLCDIQSADTISGHYPMNAKWISLGSSAKLYSIAGVGVPLVIGGLVAKGEDDYFRSLRNDYLPQFRNHTDDFLQYAPVALMLGLKAAGVEGRNSWGRMLASDALSAITMAAVVNTLKHTTCVMRPDGSDNYSFPSGHTATAFMTATILTKEYGHKSPWIGIGAYAMATATGLMRIANNKHWLSDVLTGAGIGILSTEMGYLIGDLIFKDKGINRPDAPSIFRVESKPSFLSLYVGMNVPLSQYDIDEHTTFRTSSGSSAGVEGAYFFNRYVGVGGRFTVSNTALITNGNHAEDNSFDAVSLCGGGYFSLPMSQRWMLGSKLLCGWVHYPQLKLSTINVSARDGICFGSGLSTTFRVSERYGLSFFVDYNLLPSHNNASKEWMNTIACGLSFSIMW